MLVESPWVSLEPYPVISLWDALASAGRKYADKTAFIASHSGQRYTFGEIIRAAEGFGNYLAAQGYARGEKFGIFSPNCAEYVVAVFGALRAGLTVTTMNPLYKEREVEHQLQDAEARIVLAFSPMRPVVDAAVPHCPLVRDVHALEEVWDLAAKGGADGTPVLIDPMRDLAFLPYSSGTTGLPKGVMLSHYNIVSNCRQFLALGSTPAHAVVLDFLPFFHIYGLTVLLLSGFIAGATQVTMMRFDLEQCLALIQEHRVSNLFVVPPALLALANTPLHEKYDTSSLRFIFSGAAPLPGEIEERAESVYGCPVLQGYGMTETSPVTHASPMLWPKRGWVGPPISDTIERVVSPTTGEECALGEIGELWVKGPQIMQGYWKNPEATSAMLLPDGWLKTGDIVVQDEQGYVKIVDRAREMIKYKGYQVAPAELEGVLLEHPGLVDAAVVPKPDFESGEVPKAFVVLRAGHSPGVDEIMRFVEERVAPYKKVREIEFVDAIPRNPSGKILRRQLIEQERAKAASASG